MVNQASRRSTKKSQSSKPDSQKGHPKSKGSKTDQNGESLRYLVFGGILLISVIGCIIYFTLYSIHAGSKTSELPNREKQTSFQTKTSTNKPKSTPIKDNTQHPFADFKPFTQRELKMAPTIVNGKSIRIQELKLHNNTSSVRAYVIENFLSDSECDNLMRVHNKHLHIYMKNDPIMCFDSMETLAKNIKQLNLKYKVSLNVFTKGTTCLNESFSSELKPHFKWSYSTAFYPGENKFSISYAQRIKDATGLNQVNGGKFQITSYPVGVGYKSHTDCIVYAKGKGEKRDRYATVLVYLQDVDMGGETEFPLLGIKVKPKKGLALVWNSMDEQGNCEPLSLHDAKKVHKGHKYILQRWYYYQNFPALGKRPPEPSVPQRKDGQPRVSCDEYEHGSCRWYDEWNYDHILEYTANMRNMV